MAKSVKGSSKAKKRSAKSPEPPFDPTAHELVPRHEKLSEKEARELLEGYHVSLSSLPKIKSGDPAIRSLGAKQGDIIRITRKSRTAGETVFYRGVIDG